jgi:TolB protein
MLGLLLIFSGIVAVLSVGGQQSASAGTFPGTNGKIAFVSDRDGNYEIYVMNPDGSNQQRLTDNLALDSEPSWSPDGTRIAFTSDRNGNHEIYVMNADGSGQRRLTNHHLADSNPSWSPDGTKIIFVKDFNYGYRVEQYQTYNGLGYFWIMNADGTNQNAVPLDDDYGSHPSWSPDGNKIAYSCPGATSAICTIEPDGSNWEVTIETCNSDSDAFGPSWSPDGKKIVYTETSDSEHDCHYDGTTTDGAIFVANVDGSDRVMLEDGSEISNDARLPSWSPGGDKIVFASLVFDGSGNGYDIWIMDRDGTNRLKLTNNKAFDSLPDWGSNGPLHSNGCTNPTITGTDGPDWIRGTAGADIIDAKGGDDTINGLGGNDIICGGSGSDSISGGSGSDLIFGGHGNDVIIGGLGNDELYGGAGKDSLSGNGGYDKMFGNSGNDTLNGKDGLENNDYLDGGSGTDSCEGNPDPEVNCEK